MKRIRFLLGGVFLLVSCGPPSHSGQPQLVVRSFETPRSVPAQEITPVSHDQIVTVTPEVSQPQYVMEFQYAGSFPTSLIGEQDEAPPQHYIQLQAQDKKVEPTSLAVSYRMADTLWVDGSGQVTAYAPRSLPQQWHIKVFHADEQGHKHGFPIATDTHSGSFSSVTWNGVLPNHELAANGEYVMEFVPEGYALKPIDNIWDLSNFALPLGDIPPPDYNPEHLLVKFKDPITAQSRYTILKTDENGWSQVAPPINATLESLAQQLSGDQAVASAEPDFFFEPLFTPNDPEVSNQYALSKIQAFPAWDINQSGEDVTIAVVDTGVDLNHPDLKDKLIAGFNALDNNTNVRDDHGHGTHVSGIAAGIGNNGAGIAGLALKARLMPIKVLGNGGQGSAFAVANGIHWAAEHGASVINLSLGARMGSSALLDAIQFANGKGVVVVAAMGNDGGNIQNYPAAYAGTVNGLIAVGSTDAADQRSFFSNFGNWISVSAPGSGILSTLPGYVVPMNPAGELYGMANGTSMATPYVAGLAALVKNLHPAFSPAQIRDAIQKGADDLGAHGFDPHFGYGRINALKTLGLADDGQPPATESLPTPQPTSTPQAIQGFGGLVLDVN